MFVDERYKERLRAERMGELWCLPLGVGSSKNDRVTIWNRLVSPQSNITARKIGHRVLRMFSTLTPHGGHSSLSLSPYPHPTALRARLSGEGTSASKLEKKHRREDPIEYLRINRLLWFCTCSLIGFRSVVASWESKYESSIPVEMNTMHCHLDATTTLKEHFLYRTLILRSRVRLLTLVNRSNSGDELVSSWSTVMRRILKRPLNCSMVQF